MVEYKYVLCYISYMIDRYKLQKVRNSLAPGKVSILYGARRTGKTTLVGIIASEYDAQDVLSLRGDSLKSAKELQDKTYSDESIRLWLGSKKILIVDEAQAVSGIGLILKNIVDVMTNLIVLVTGSSSFELSQQIGEPLVGRSSTHMLYPLSASEVAGGSSEESVIDEMMIFGGYPQVVSASTYDDKHAVLSNLADGSLFRDIFAREGINNSRKIYELLKLIAYQVGSEVSVAEVCNKTGMNRGEVETYLDLFEKSFILFSLGGLSRNLRKEVTKFPKYYFYDLGIRNAVIDNLKSIGDRDDSGALWENFCMIERIKRNDMHSLHSANYFWRTTDMQEIDLVEDRGGQLYAYEFKLTKYAKAPKVFLDSYNRSTFMTVNRQNVWEFIL
jgi:uncharacterized protein